MELNSWKVLPLALDLGIGRSFQFMLEISVINSPAEHLKSFISEILKRYGSSLNEAITLLWSFIVSIYSTGGLLGSMCSGYLSVRFGNQEAPLHYKSQGSLCAGECAPQKLPGVIAITASTARAIGMFVGYSALDSDNET
ncbi:LOW QUALITY PROTEIN: solute carrier family 2, facilitated glucose transporter member 11-like [Pangshura tecta]